MKTKGLVPRTWRFIKKLFLVLFILHLVYILILKWVYPPITVTQLSSLLNGDGLRRDYVSADQMSVNAKLAVIAAEDQLFADHSGFDWKSIEKAMAYNKRKPNRVHGASTISQQVAKNVFYGKAEVGSVRDWKCIFTFMIELLWGKKRILEMYLNVSEMGKGVFGIEAAAQYNFGKPAIKLTRQEAAMIAACLPNPKKYTVKPTARYVSTRYRWVTRQMNNLEEGSGYTKIVDY